MALAADELTVGKSHAHNGKWVDITIRKVNTLLSMDEDADWQKYLKYINIDLKFVEEQRLNLLSKYNKMVFELNKCRDELIILKQAKLDAVTFQIQNTELIYEQIPHQKKKVLGCELLIESSSKRNENENLFIPASMGILVPESQVVNESLETLNTPESSKDSEAEFLTLLPPLKILQVASPSSEDSSNESVSRTVTVNESKTFRSMRWSIASLKRSKNYKAQPYQYASSSKQILRAKAKPFPLCTNCGFNDHILDDCRNYPECEISLRDCLDDGVAASFQRSRIHKPHAHTQAFKVNRSTSR
ncbi:hypothetical protein Tco_0734557 [Tanacetum coccineum]